MGSMFGIDISNYQAGLDPAKVKSDFVICKASEGTTFKDKYMDGFMKKAMDAGKLVGVYHFANGKSSGKQEADFFLSVVKAYIGKAILVLDWEGNALSKGPSYAKAFADRVYEKTGIKIILYGSIDNMPGDWKSFSKKYPNFWGACYASNPVRHGYSNDIPREHQLKLPFTEIIRQYSSNTYLPGWSGRLDANKCYISKKEWKALCKKEETKNEDDKKKDSVDEVAKKIIAGTDGWDVTGQARVDKLKKEGYDPVEVQNRVNELMGVPTKSPKMSNTEVAMKIIRGENGWNVNGRARVDKLKKEGYDPNAVQKEINRIMAGK